MSYRSVASMGALAVVIAGMALAPGFASGQAPTAAPAAADTWTSARTPWGDPDLQGIWSPGYYLTPLERPDKFAGREFLTHEEVAVLEQQAAVAPGRNARLERGSFEDVEGAYNDVFTGRGRFVVRTKRTSLIVDPPDGKIPFTPEAQKKAASSRRATPAELAAASVTRSATATPYPVSRDGGGLADNPEDRPSDRCLGISLPHISGSGTFSRLVQTPAYVTIYYEEGHRGGAYRTIPLDGRPHLPPHIRQRLGDSRGRWEGDALVVDTINFTDKTNFQGSRENLHLIERFTRVGADMIKYEITIEDPSTFTRPWTIELPLTKADDHKNQIFEAACHEGNYAMTSILAGARALEKERATEATKKKGSR